MELGVGVFRTTPLVAPSLLRNECHAGNSGGNCSETSWLCSLDFQVQILFLFSSVDSSPISVSSFHTRVPVQSSSNHFTQGLFVPVLTNPTKAHSFSSHQSSQGPLVQVTPVQPRPTCSGHTNPAKAHLFRSHQSSQSPLVQVTPI